MCDLTGLHDVILKAVAIDIDAETVVLVLRPVQFEGAPEQVTLVAQGWKALSCPKRDPWGHSEVWRVNEARGSVEPASGLQRLELEMQSGDVIEIEATSFERRASDQ